MEFILFPPQLLSMMQFTADPGVKGEEIAPLRTLFPNLTTFTFVVSRSFSAGLGEQHVVGFLKSYVEEAPHAKRVLWDTSGQADISRALGKIYSNGYELTTSRFTSRDRLAKPKEDNTFKSYSSKQEMNDDDAWEDLDSDDEPIQHREDHDDVWEDLDSDDEPIQHRRHKTRRGWKQRNNRAWSKYPPGVNYYPGEKAFLDRMLGADAMDGVEDFFGDNPGRGAGFFDFAGNVVGGQHYGYGENYGCEYQLYRD